MTDELAFVGDVHGNLDALRGLFEALETHDAPHVVLLGDYINKGPSSSGVMQEIVERAQSGCATLLAGNHEEALLEAFDTHDLSTFLKMGGAVTIRSYVGGDVGPDVLRDFRENFPGAHLDALRRMAKTYESTEFIAQHVGPPASDGRFRISAHVPVGELPRIRKRSAQLDTGCGSATGRLTALLWPSLRYLQVDARGVLLQSAPRG